MFWWKIVKRLWVESGTLHVEVFMKSDYLRAAGGKKDKKYMWNRWFLMAMKNITSSKIRFLM